MIRNARALYFTAPEKLELRNEPVAPAPGERIFTSRLIGISHGTEMLYYRGTFPVGEEGDQSVPSGGSGSGYPIKYGYMNVAQDESGSRFFCFYPHQDRFALAPTAAVPLPDKLDDDDAVFLPSMETAVGIVQDTAPVLGDVVLVIGQGVIGLLVAELLLRSGASRVVTVDPVAERRERSRLLGCTSLDPDDPGLEAQVRNASGGRHPDYAVHVSGTARGLQLALDLLPVEGTAVEASWHGDREVPLRLGTGFHRRRLTIRSSQVSRIGTALAPRWTKERRMGMVLDLLAELRPSRYITHRFPLEVAERAYREIADRPDRVLQAILKP